MIIYKKKYLPKEKNYMAHFLPNSMFKNKIKTKKNEKDDKKKLIQFNLSYHVEFASWVVRSI
jgi:hypothetical protein